LETPSTLWETGSTGALLAEARIATEPYEGRDLPNEILYYFTPPEEPRWLGVDLDIVRKFGSLLSRSQLLADETLANTQLIRNPCRTNFPISERVPLSTKRTSTQYLRFSGGIPGWLRLSPWRLGYGSGRQSDGSEITEPRRTMVSSL
jgi:hypothetical protein